MEIYQQTILSHVMNFATNEMHHKCGIWNIFPNKNEQGRKERTNEQTNEQTRLVSQSLKSNSQGVCMSIELRYTRTLSFITGVLLF